MSVRFVVTVTVLAVVGVSACASAPAKADVQAPPARERYTFVKRPAKPRGCAFEVFEAPREPVRPYEVLGTLPMSTNVWLGEKGREALLRDTACRAGADAVLLPAPSERTVGDIQVREYQATFVAYTDASATPEAHEVLAPPADEGTVFVPIGEDVLGDTNGTLKRPIGPEDDAYWQ